MSEFVDWAELPYFLAIVEEGSLRAAAQQMGTTHATVSRHLESLEAAYGTHLFKRTPEGLALTLAGEELLPTAMRAEQAVLDGRRRLTGLDREAAGRVRVTVTPMLAFNVLPKIFADFVHFYPDIELEIDVSNTYQDLARNKTDVSIRMAFGVTEDMLGRKLQQYRLAPIASVDYIKRNLPNAGPKGEGLTWLGWGPWADDKNWVRDSAFPKADRRHVAMEALLQVRLVSEGVGMALLPSFVLHFDPTLQVVPGASSYPDRSIWLLLHGDLKDSVRVRPFVEFVASEFKKRRKIFEDDAG